MAGVMGRALLLHHSRFLAPLRIDIPIHRPSLPNVSSHSDTSQCTPV